MDPLADGVIVALLGAGVGLAELVARYRDAPLRAVATLPGVCYLVLNAGAAAAALALIRAFGWSFGVSADAGPEALRWWQGLVAGFGAMALFRSALFTVRGEETLAVGPASLLQAVLTAANRGVDRARAQARLETVSACMGEISFAKGAAALPAICLALMQDLPEEDQQRLGRQVAELQKAEMDDPIKALVLGLAVIDAVGEEVLRAAVKALGEQLREK